jgi:hypothetical protein
LSGRHDHHRGWVVERIKLLVTNFAIDVGFLAILRLSAAVYRRSAPEFIDAPGTFL